MYFTVRSLIILFLLLLPLLSLLSRPPVVRVFYMILATTSTTTAAISRDEPDFSFKTQPSALTRRKDNASSPKGKLWVKLIGARHLSSPSSASRPYVVVTFDQNEFVSREPVHEEHEEAAGVAIRVTEGSTAKGTSPNTAAASPLARDASPAPPAGPPLASPTLAPAQASGLRRALHQNSNSNGNGTATPPSSTVAEPAPASASSSAAPGAADDDMTLASSAVSSPKLLTSDDAYNPTWKHEVFLCVKTLGHHSRIVG